LLALVVENVFCFQRNRAGMSPAIRNLGFATGGVLVSLTAPVERFIALPVSTLCKPEAKKLVSPTP
jgi:hypothetical protein